MSMWNILINKITVSQKDNPEAGTFHISRVFKNELTIKFISKDVNIQFKVNKDSFAISDESDRFTDMLFGNYDAEVVGILPEHICDEWCGLIPSFLCLLCYFLVNRDNQKCLNFFEQFKSYTKFEIGKDGGSIFLPADNDRIISIASSGSQIGGLMLDLMSDVRY